MATLISFCLHHDILPALPLTSVLPPMPNVVAVLTTVLLYRGRLTEITSEYLMEHVSLPCHQIVLVGSRHRPRLKFESDSPSRHSLFVRS